MSAADALQALGAVLLGLAAVCAVWAVHCTRVLDLAAVTFGFAACVAAAMVALRLSHLGQGMALYFPIALLLTLGASSGAAQEPSGSSPRGSAALVVGGVGLMAALMLIAGPIQRAQPPGAARTRRALLESDVVEGVQAALLTFHAGWLVSAVAVLSVGAVCVLALLAEPQRPGEARGRP